MNLLFFFSSRRRHTRSKRDWSSDVCSSDLWSAGFQFSGDLRQPLRGGGALLPGELEPGAPARPRHPRGASGWRRQLQLAGRSEERRVGKESSTREGRTAGNGKWYVRSESEI